jgi:hypothetical protein
MKGDLHLEKIVNYNYRLDFNKTCGNVIASFNILI